MSLTLIRNRLVTPERIVRMPRRVRGGWAFTHPATDLWRYNARARRQAIREWAQYGAAALASIVGGGFVGMALTADEPGPIPPVQNSAAPGFNGRTLDAAGEYQGHVFRAPKSGSLRSFQASFTVATGSPTADFSYESVDQTTGLPTGTALGATNNCKVAGVSVTVGWVDPGNFGEDASVTRGDLVAAVIRYASGTTFNTASPVNNNFFPIGGGNTTVFNNGTPTRSVGTGVSKLAFAVKYSDGTYPYIPDSMPQKDNTWSESFNNSSNPNHRGNVYTNPTPKRCIGGWCLVPSSSQDFDLIIATNGWDGTADDDGSSNLYLSVDKDIYGTNGYPAFLLSDQTIDFAAGSKYRSLVKPTTGTNITFYRMEVNSAAIMEQVGLTNLIYTAANNPTGSGDWTDTNTKRAFCGFWVDKNDDGAGAGGVNRAAMPSGLSALG